MIIMKVKEQLCSIANTITAYDLATQGVLLR